MKYSISEKRELNLREIEILSYLFENDRPRWLPLLPDLKVIARCGCGVCPTILLGHTFNSEVQNGCLMIDYQGKDTIGNLIGVSLFGTDKEPTQL